MPIYSHNMVLFIALYVAAIMLVFWFRRGLKWNRRPKSSIGEKA